MNERSQRVFSNARSQIVLLHWITAVHEESHLANYTSNVKFGLILAWESANTPNFSL